MRVVGDALWRDLREILLEWLEHEEADSDAEAHHREETALREAEEDGEALQVAVDDGEHLAVMGAQEGEVVQRRLRRLDHLAHVLDG